VIAYSAIDLVNAARGLRTLHMPLIAVTWVTCVQWSASYSAGCCADQRSSSSFLRSFVRIIKSTL